jgi:hypothetical protein
VRYTHVMAETRHLLEPEVIFNTVKAVATAAR